MRMPPASTGISSAPDARPHSACCLLFGIGRLQSHTRQPLHPTHGPYAIWRGSMTPMAARPFHLGWFLQGSSVQAWGEPWTGHIGTTWMVPDLFLDMARSLERACFDYILLEDCSYVGESYQRLHRDLPEERHRRAAAGPVGGGVADDRGHLAHRHRADLRHLCLSALSAGPAGGDAGPGFRRAASAGTRSPAAPISRR